MGNFKASDPLPNANGTTIGEALLTPTTIYDKPILEILKTCGDNIHGLAHITGGAFSKLNRLKAKNRKFGFLLNNLIDPPIIFKEIQNIINIDEEELYKTFNMGIGFCIIANKKSSKDILQISNKLNFPAQIIGKIISDEKIIIYTYTKNEIIL